MVEFILLFFLLKEDQRERAGKGEERGGGKGKRGKEREKVSYWGDSPAGGGT